MFGRVSGWQDVSGGDHPNVLVKKRLEKYLTKIELNKKESVQGLLNEYVKIWFIIGPVLNTVLTRPSHSPALGRAEGQRYTPMMAM